MSTDAKSTSTRRFSNLPGAARGYVVAVQLLGLVALGYCVLESVARGEATWLLLAALTGITSFLGIQVPLPAQRGGGFGLTVSDCFVFTAMLLYGPAAAVFLAAIDGLAGNVRFKVRTWFRFLFNFAQIPLVAFLVANLFYLVRGETAPLQGTVFDLAVLGAIGLCAIAYFTLGSFSVAAGLALSSGQSLPGLWKRYFPWASPATVMSAAAGMLFFVAFGKEDTATAALWFLTGVVLLTLSTLYNSRGSRSLVVRLESPSN